jgi:hypothetical protein
MMPDHLELQIFAGWLVAKLIELVKTSARPGWMNQGTDKLNRRISVIMSVLTGAGFTFDWQGTLISGGVLSIAVPELHKIVEFFIHSGFGYVVQESVYRTTIKPYQGIR